MSILETGKKLEKLNQEENIQIGQNILEYLDKYNISEEEFDEYNDYIERVLEVENNQIFR